MTVMNNGEMECVGLQKTRVWSLTVRAFRKTVPSPFKAIISAEKLQHESQFGLQMHQLSY